MNIKILQIKNIVFLNDLKKTHKKQFSYDYSKKLSKNN